MIPAPTFGLVTGGNDKGFIHLEGEPPSPVVGSLDDIPPEVLTEAERGTTHKHGTAYRKLSGDWYMYYGWDD